MDRNTKIVVAVGTASLFTAIGLQVSDFHNNYVALMCGLGAAASYVYAGWHKMFGGSEGIEIDGARDLRDGGASPPTLSVPASIRADTWLQDAVAFVLYGHWPAQDETIFGKDNDLPRMGAIIENMRSFAHDGQLQIWGRQTNLSLHVPISSDFWVNNVIELDTLWGPPETPRTASIEFNAPSPFMALKVNRAQLEGLWPPATATSAIYVSLRDAAVRVMNATLANEIGAWGMSEPTANDRLNWYAHWITGSRKIPLYGKRPPATQRELISNSDGLAPRYHFRGGAEEIYEGYSDSVPSFIELEVKESDLQENWGRLSTP